MVGRTALSTTVGTTRPGPVMLIYNTNSTSMSVARTAPAMSVATGMKMPESI